MMSRRKGRVQGPKSLLQQPNLRFINAVGRAGSRTIGRIRCPMPKYWSRIVTGRRFSAGNQSRPPPVGAMDSFLKSPRTKRRPGEDDGVHVARVALQLRRAGPV